MRQIEPGLVAFHDIQQRNGFLQPRRPHGAVYLKKLEKFIKNADMELSGRARRQRRPAYHSHKRQTHGNLWSS